MQRSSVIEDENRRSGFVDVLRMLFSDFLQCFKCRTLLSWSLWWALATCGHFLIINYAQVLWENIRPSQDYEIYNGYVETLSTLLGKGHLPAMIIFLYRRKESDSIRQAKVSPRSVSGRVLRASQNVLLTV